MVLKKYLIISISYVLLAGHGLAWAEGQYLGAYAKARRDYTRQLTTAINSGHPLSTEERHALAKQLTQDVDKAYAADTLDLYKKIAAVSKKIREELKAGTPKRDDAKIDNELAEKDEKVEKPAATSNQKISVSSNAPSRDAPSRANSVASRKPASSVEPVNPGAAENVSFSKPSPGGASSVSFGNKETPQPPSRPQAK